ncbi:hypothetical protein F5J12DRAFT_783059 [Pisolithus orientalis]|uniref:uncharacterized protein n=1 Tax=Pisolithus orientalis TaxID=936130 RepID=UPI00222434C7|nr:uncharacterized protein F5J12DRAFT_783059 [Pisolithus orientalis]KAI6006293.1 hypothetical protein F5J12DRAFT_783059 [Pisolithus orientalis]
MSGYSCHTSDKQKKLRKSETSAVVETGNVSFPDTPKSDKDQHTSKCMRRWSHAPSPEAEDEKLEWKCTNVLDSLKFTASESESEDELEHDAATFQLMGVGEADLCAQLVNLAVSAGDDPLGETWLPLRKAKCAAQ